jgi:hypothetical protein
LRAATKVSAGHRLLSIGNQDLAQWERRLQQHGKDLTLRQSSLCLGAPGHGPHEHQRRKKMSTGTQLMRPPVRAGDQAPAQKELRSGTGEKLLLTETSGWLLWMRENRHRAEKKASSRLGTGDWAMRSGESSPARSDKERRSTA